MWRAGRALAVPAARALGYPWRVSWSCWLAGGCLVPRAPRSGWVGAVQGWGELGLGSCAYTPCSVFLLRDSRRPPDVGSGRLGVGGRSRGAPPLSPPSSRYLFAGGGASTSELPLGCRGLPTHPPAHPSPRWPRPFASQGFLVQLLQCIGAVRAWGSGLGGAFCIIHLLGSSASRPPHGPHPPAVATKLAWAGEVRLFPQWSMHLGHWLPSPLV
jgi:hypothetical protein